jgi:chitodextrinase
MPHSYWNHLRRLLGRFVLPCVVLFPHLVSASNLRFAWTGSADPNVVGYKLSYGTSSHSYSKTLDAGNATAATVSSLTPGATYYFVVTAYNSIGLQSLPSNEVSLTLSGNVPPTVSLTSPQAGASLNGNSPISMTATASDSDGSIVKVEFYQGSNKIGEATTAPYAATWTNAPSGNFTMTALAYDDSGAAVRSAGVPITVFGTSPAPSASPSAGDKVRVVAMTPIIKAGGTAKFKIVASQVDRTQDTIVNYSLTGTAAAGVNYSQAGLSGNVKIPAGNRAVLLPLPTMTVPGASKATTAVVTVLPGTGYVATRATAVVRIVNH